MEFSWGKIKKPVYCLAPMAGISNSSFRLICRSFGADVVFSEMISADGIAYGSQKTIDLMTFRSDERPYIVQIFGNDAVTMKKAASYITKNVHPDGIDINMGCPAKKVSGHGRGAALLKNFDEAKRIVSVVRETSPLPLSVKMRLGWKEFDIQNFVRDLEKIGIDAITIHARTKEQGFKGEPDWEAIGEIVQSVRIPVIGNGNVTSREDALKLRQSSKCAGIMIGRGALGRPWIFKEIKESTECSPSKEEILSLVLRQLNLTIQDYGEQKGILEMRKFFSWYLRGFKEAKKMRNKLVQTNSINEIEVILRER